MAPLRIKRNMEAEIEFVLGKIKSSDLVLELECVYGRGLKKILEKTKTVVGIDTSHDSLLLLRDSIVKNDSCNIFGMDAVQLGFKNCRFDIVVCIQNGISAFKVDQRKLIGEIDEEATGGGVIVCKDGFNATTMSPNDFVSLTSGFEVDPIVTEVDGSCLFFEIMAK